MQIMLETWSSNSIKTLKAVIDGRLLTVNILCQHLSLIETLNFLKNKLTKLLTCHLARNKVWLFQMAIAPENLEIFHFF